MSTEGFPGFNQLFHLRESRLAFSAQYQGEMPEWADELALIKGESRPRAPVEFVQNLGKVPLDLVYGSTSLYLISAAAREAFEGSGLTGWDTFPVNLYDRHGKPFEGYSGLAIRGRCGPPDENRANAVRRISPGGRPYRARFGLFFDEASWDGSDFVLPRSGPAWIIVSKTVVSVAKRAKLRNFGFEPLTEYEHVRMNTEWLDDRAN